MRKTVYLYIVILLTVLTVPCLAQELTYEMAQSPKEILTDGWQEILSFLPESIRDEMSQMDLQTGDGIREKTSPVYWMRQILTGIKSWINADMPGILQLFSLMLFMSAVELSMSNAPSKNLHQAFAMLSSLISAVMLFRITDGIMSSAQLYLNRVCGLMNLMAPIMEGLFLAGGNLTQKAVTTEAVMLGVTLVGNFSGQILAPLTQLLFTLSCLGSVCGDMKISGFTGGLRKLIQRLWQFGTLLFSFLLSVQSILAKSADSLAAKTARFAIGSFIPVAGGVIAEAFSTLKEGVNVLRTGAGVGGILVILFLLIPGILPLVLYKCTLSLGGSAADALNLGGMRGMLSEIHGIVDLLFGFVLYTSLMFVLSIIIFTKTQAGL